MLEVIRRVFDKSTEFLGSDMSQEDKARKLMVRIVNALTVKQEIGAPMAALYLLGNSDHYTNFQYQVFYWQEDVAEVKRSWNAASEQIDGEDSSNDILDRNSNDLEDDTKVAIHRNKREGRNCL